MSEACVVLSGGVGGAKLALGLDRLLPAGALSVIANVGDDFTHLGLRICPDLDTLLYTLADRVNSRTGWGRRDESWNFLGAIAELGGPDWFRLGDRDLAVHVLRSAALSSGESLSRITARLCERFGLATRLLPATDDRLATCLHTRDGVLSFQEYFVRLRAKPAVTRIEYAGAESANLSPEVRATLTGDGPGVIVIAPSNPYLSIDPILAVPGMRDALRAAGAPVLAVSPIVGGRALKGPTAKIMRELGLTVNAGAIATHYRDLIDGFILDNADRELADGIAATGVPVRVCNTVMTELKHKTELAARCLTFAAELRESRP